MSRTTLRMRELRAKRVAAGLTTEGKKRVNKRHPELAGLTGREYHTAFMRKQREQDRLAWEI